ncbi:ABC transporter permease [Alkalicoccobacillus murimartini]|uniref:Peptide/nickel transport system permease protein n=1 Tax=Alkalicoccobacillus murimartini TaxID=171685 RepID=A0ABT9YNF2_9BACI|nr:ABC transporter permease [Alkalicoccobacillus murimartini]MDQ0209169.1 peptide/nickel transport system permease protein [Alkalicoccobacillus murimartini]
MSYIKRSLLQIIPSLIILAFIIFALVYLAGDPVSLMLPENATAEDRAILAKSLGLDQPFYIQFFDYMKNLITGNFGESYLYNEPALGLVTERLGATLWLSAMAMFVAIGISIPLGIIAALKRNTLIDFLVSAISIVGKAMPNFWIGIMLILFFAVTFQIFPVSGASSPMHFVLPSITLGVALAAEMTRLIRASVLEILDQEFVQTARSKGQLEWIVISKHVFLNALIPVVTIIGLQFPQLIGGAIVVETVFSWPGIGRLLLRAMEAKDMAVVQAIVFVIALITIVVNILTDLLYRFLDPRIKYE